LRANRGLLRQPGRRVRTGVAFVLFFSLLSASTAAASKTSGGAGLPPNLPPKAKAHQGLPAPPPLPTSLPLGPAAQLSPDGHTAIPPLEAPAPVRNAIYAANRINRKPYRYGGGHRRFKDKAYDCSGAVSYVLHAGGFLAKPRDSSALIGWGDPGPGEWITVYTSRRHAYVIIAGLRLDTSGSPSGPRWRRIARTSDGFVARHPAGF
jgi:cell wall-associated NlpC family hydrolase